MEHIIPAINWTTVLADTIKIAKDGDTIIVSSNSVKELADRAHHRLCPNKVLIFVVRAIVYEDYV